jgi:hypothetical protein
MVPSSPGKMPYLDQAFQGEFGLSRITQLSQNLPVNFFLKIPNNRANTR